MTGASAAPASAPDAALERPFRAPQPALRRRTEALALALAVGVFVLLAGARAARLTYPFFDDVSYLELAIRVRALGGPLGLLRELLGGRWLEANRHPLYLAILSLFARPHPAFHREAQAVTIAIGALALLSCWWQARRHFGPFPALVVAWCLAIGRTFIDCAAHPWTEPLLLVLWAPAVGALLDGATARAWRIGPWLRFGVWSGLAYLTKGTAIFLPVSFALALLVAVGWRVAVDRRAWVAAAGFVLAASPLLVRDVRAFGRPLYNQNGGMLWMNRLPDFAEVFAPQAKAELPHGFVEYVRQLTPASLGWRLATGLGETAFILLDAVAPDAERPGSAVHIAMLAAALAVIAVALRRLRQAPRGLARTSLLAQVGWTCAILFVFSVNGNNSRYFLPLAATVILPFFGARVAEDLVSAGTALRSRWVVRAGAVGAGAVVLALLFPPPPMSWAPGMREVAAWMVEHVRPGETFVVDARSHLQVSWLVPQATQLIVSASWKERPVDERLLLEHLRQNHVRWVVLDASSTAHMATPGDPAGRRYLFYDRLPLGPDGSLPADGFPPGLKPVYLDAGSPRRWVVLETTSPEAASGPGSRMSDASGGSAR